MNIVANIIIGILNFYTLAIFIYIILSWVPSNPEGNVVEDLRNALATICEPYLSLFRFIPPIGGVLDISPILAIIVLELISYGVSVIL